MIPPENRRRKERRKKMTWPDVLPALAVVVGAAASLLGVALALRRLFRPWVADVTRGIPPLPVSDDGAAREW